MCGTRPAADIPTSVVHVCLVAAVGLRWCMAAMKVGVLCMLCGRWVQCAHTLPWYDLVLCGAPESCFAGQACA